MKILELTKNLASIASNIYANSWKVTYSGIVPQKYLNELSPERWTPILENTKHKCFMLQDNGIFVATSSIVTAREKLQRLRRNSIHMSYPNISEKATEKSYLNL